MTREFLNYVIEQNGKILYKEYINKSLWCFVVIPNIVNNNYVLKFDESTITKPHFKRMCNEIGLNKVKYIIDNKLNGITPIDIENL